MADKVQFATVLIIVMVIAFFAFLGGFIIFNFLVMPSVTRQGEQIKVPNLRDLNRATAEKTVTDLKLRLDVIGEAPDSLVVKGNIVVQRPDAGDVVKPGRLIQVILSSGKGKIDAIELADISYRQAQLVLKQRRIDTGEISRVFSTTHENEIVINADPAVTSKILAAQKVSLLTSLGPSPVLYLMPDLTGKQEADVKRWLKSMNFIIGKTNYQFDAQAIVGQILAQKPEPGFAITNGDSIQLIVNGG